MNKLPPFLSRYLLLSIRINRSQTEIAEKLGDISPELQNDLKKSWQMVCEMYGMMIRLKDSKPINDFQEFFEL